MPVTFKQKLFLVLSVNTSYLPLDVVCQVSLISLGGPSWINNKKIHHNKNTHQWKYLTSTDSSQHQQNNGLLWEKISRKNNRDK